MDGVPSEIRFDERSANHLVVPGPLLDHLHHLEAESWFSIKLKGSVYKVQYKAEGFSIGFSIKLKGSV